MKFRLLAFLSHFLLSVLLLASALGCLYWGWYASPNWILAGATKIVGLMIVVDVCIGPIATLIVSSPRKPFKVLQRDWLCIFIVQVLAFGYGGYALWAGRPIAYVLEGDHVSLLSMSDYSQDDILESGRKGRPWPASLIARPVWVWMDLDGVEDAEKKIVSGAIFNGKSLVAMPRFYKPWSQAEKAIRADLHPVGDLTKNASAYKCSQDDLALVKDESEWAGYLSVQARSAEAVVLIDKKSLNPARILCIKSYQ